MKQQLNITIDEKLLSQFKKDCFLRGLRMNTVIESLIYMFLTGSVSYEDA